MRLRNKSRHIKAVCRGVPCLVLFLALGCTPAARRGSNTSTMVKPMLATSAAAPPARVEQDATGFTITQDVIVTDAVRAEYESAVRMNAPDLATQVVNRTRTINFGAKEGVQAVTIVYPIDFLPAA